MPINKARMNCVFEAFPFFHMSIQPIANSWETMHKIWYIKFYYIVEIMSDVKVFLWHKICPTPVGFVFLAAQSAHLKHLRLMQGFASGHFSYWFFILKHNLTYLLLQLRLHIVSKELQNSWAWNSSGLAQNTSVCGCWRASKHKAWSKLYLKDVFIISWPPSLLDDGEIISSFLPVWCQLAETSSHAAW